MASKVIGLEKLRRKLKRLPVETKAEIRKALVQSAAEIVALQKSLAPKDDGALQRSIDWTFGDPPSTRATGAFRPKRETYVALSDDIKLTIYAGDDEAFYARWIEFGTAPHSLTKGADAGRGKRQGGGRQHPGTTAQPFFYPGYRALKKRTRSRIARAINRAAKKVAKT